MSDFSKNLKKLRVSKKLTQEELATQLGVGKSTISMYESGAREPNFEMLETIADFFNVNLDRLMTGVKYQADNKNTYGDHNKNLEHLADKPELLNLYNDIYESETLQLLFDNARDLEPEDLEAILIHIKGIRTARGLD